MKVKINTIKINQALACTSVYCILFLGGGVCIFLCFWIFTIMWVWAINSSCDRKMRHVKSIPWESEKMQKESNRAGKISNWEAESYRLMEGMWKKRSFPNCSDERMGAMDESRLALIRLSWHWVDSASSTPPRLHFVPHRQMIIGAPFNSPRATEVSPWWGFPSSLPPSPLRFLLIKTLSTLKCSTTSRILFVCSSCLPPRPPSFCYFFMTWGKKCTSICNFWAFAHMNSCKIT